MALLSIRLSSSLKSRDRLFTFVTQGRLLELIPLPSVLRAVFLLSDGAESPCRPAPFYAPHLNSQHPESAQKGGAICPMDIWLNNGGVEGALIVAWDATALSLALPVSLTLQTPTHQQWPWLTRTRAGHCRTAACNEFPVFLGQHSLYPRHSRHSAHLCQYLGCCGP